MSPPRIFVIGYPGDVGGANTECWHTVRLWRRFGLEVGLIPTWQADPQWRGRLDAIGCRTHPASPERLGDVPGLRGGVVVAFCNSQFLRCAERLRELGCRLVWLNCMTWLFAAERRHYRDHGPFDAYVFQSRYQRSELGPQLARYGVRPGQCHEIRGAFAWEEFPFRPRGRAPGEPLVVGRISRAAPDKFAADSWSVYARVKHPIRVRVLGWSAAVERKLGRRPDWAECLPPGAESPERFFASLHAMLQLNGGAAENWPRSGLEAMASGVAVVAEDRWGWPEMVRHGETGLLADTPDELAASLDRLAGDEPFRLELVHRARAALEGELAHPEALFAGWKRLFEELDR